MDDEFGTQAEFGAAIGVGQDVVSRWLCGATRPDTRMRAVLEDTYGIGWRLWDQEVAPSSRPPLKRAG